MLRHISLAVTLAIVSDATVESTPINSRTPELAGLQTSMDLDGPILAKWWKAVQDLNHRPPAPLDSPSPEAWADKQGRIYVYNSQDFRNAFQYTRNSQAINSDNKPLDAFAEWKPHQMSPIDISQLKPRRMRDVINAVTPFKPHYEYDDDLNGGQNMKQQNYDNNEGRNENGDQNQNYDQNDDGKNKNYDNNQKQNGHKNQDYVQNQKDDKNYDDQNDNGERNDRDGGKNKNDQFVSLNRQKNNKAKPKKDLGHDKSDDRKIKTKATPKAVDEDEDYWEAPARVKKYITKKLKGAKLTTKRYDNGNKGNKRTTRESIKRPDNKKDKAFNDYSDDNDKGAPSKITLENKRNKKQDSYNTKDKRGPAKNEKGVNKKNDNGNNYNSYNENQNAEIERNEDYSDTPMKDKTNVKNDNENKFNNPKTRDIDLNDSKIRYKKGNINQRDRDYSDNNENSNNREKGLNYNNKNKPKKKEKLNDYDATIERPDWDVLNAPDNENDNGYRPKKDRGSQYRPQKVQNNRDWNNKKPNNYNEPKKFDRWNNDDYSFKRRPKRDQKNSWRGVSALTNGVTASRTYDLELECQKVYKEDLRTVLKRFRKTPEYLSILEDKQKALYSRLREVIVQVIAYYSDMSVYSDRMRQRLHLQWPNTTQGKELYDQKQYYRKQAMARLRRRFHKVARRHNAESHEEEAERLDTYYALHGRLSLGERNAAKDYGFELAGQVLHAVVAAFGGQNGPRLTTNHPYGGDLADVYCEDTTKHINQHLIYTDKDASPTTETPRVPHIQVEEGKVQRSRVDTEEETDAPAVAPVTTYKTTTEMTPETTMKTTPETTIMTSPATTTKTSPKTTSETTTTTSPKTTSETTTTTSPKMTSETTIKTSPKTISETTPVGSSTTPNGTVSP